MARWTVAFVDDHLMLLQGLKAVFSADDRFSVVGLGASAAEAQELVRTLAPEILFLDLSMPGDAFATIASICQQSTTKVIVFTAFSSVDSALRALEAGASGFVLKSSSFEQLVEAVEAVHRGELFITQEYASQVLGGLRHKSRADVIAGAIRLSVREKQIIGHLLKARTNREIATSLSLSEQTIKQYMTGLMGKLNARNRVEVVIEAQRSGALD